MSLKPGTCVKPMLANPTKGIDEVMRRFGDVEFACEWKYDGERIQIHQKADGKISLFSRNQNNTTEKFPDVVRKIPLALKPTTKDFIADGEVVAWDTEKQVILPFQTLATRKRKKVGEGTIKVQVTIFLFDLLYLNGKSLIEKSFRERRRILQESFNEIEGNVVFVSNLDTSETEEIGAFMEEAIRGNCEGLMIKTLDDTYDLGKRSRNWLKLKKDYLDGLGDTVDLVVIGAYRGEGRRSGVYGAYLLAVYDPDNKEYQTLCKVGTGFTDEVLKNDYKNFAKFKINQPLKNYVCASSLTPDVWFQPKIVWEVKAYGLTVSNRHLAAKGLVDKTKGLSLRFPRFLKARDDKNPDDATTTHQLVEMYKKQEDVASFSISGGKKKK